MSPAHRTEGRHGFLQLELPVTSRDAHRQQLPPCICRLLIGLHEESATIARLAGIIGMLRPSNMATYVTSAGEFVSLSKILQQEGNEQIRALPNCNLIAVVGDVSLARILSSWRAEALIVFFGSDENAIQIVSTLASREPPWWKPTRSSYEAPFIQQLELADPFCFFSESHSSLEILGTKSAVLRCFDSVRASDLVSD